MKIHIGIIAGCFLASSVAMASPLQYDIRGYGAASSYAFTQMVRPEFGAALEMENANHQYLELHARTALKNKDPNGGIATVVSVYAGDNFLHTHIGNMPLTAGLYAGYQHLWYGPLYNNSSGGGLRVQTRVLGLTLTAKIAALYGLSGTIGWHLSCPGNDFVFYGRAAYPVNRNLSVFAFVRQERYIGDGNSLTAQDTGIGLQAKF